MMSPYVARFDRGFGGVSYSALFHGLTLKKAYGKTSVLDDTLRDGSALRGNVHTNPLIEHGFISRDGQDEQGFQDHKATVGQIGIRNIVMIVDNRCNYRCSYCQIEENMDSDQSSYAMPVSVAQKALDLFEANSRGAKGRTINLTGGEPMMNMATVRYVIDRAQHMPNTRTVMFTNGSLVTSQLADYFARAKTLMLVSLDGPRDIHDSVRFLKNGRGTHDMSLRGYELLKKAGCTVGISAVTGTHNEGRIKDVSDFFEKLDPPSIGLNFGHYLLDKPNPAGIGMNTFADILTEFYSKMRERGIFVENISRFVNPFWQEQPRLNECQAQGRGFTVDSRGKIGVCKSLLVSDRLSKHIDDIHPDLRLEPMFQQWAARSPFTLEECVRCSFVGICGGGCTYDAYVVNSGDIKRIDPHLCEYTKKITEFLVWDLFGGVKEKVGEEIYVPTIEEQEKHFQRYDPKNQLQRSVGHEKNDGGC